MNYFIWIFAYIFNKNPDAPETTHGSSPSSRSHCPCETQAKVGQI
jgi:hypothetical protein